RFALIASEDACAPVLALRPQSARADPLTQTRFMKRARKSPIFRPSAKSCLNRMILNVLDDINEMPSVADIPIKWLVLPELNLTIQQFGGFVRRIRFYRVGNFA